MNYSESTLKQHVKEYTSILCKKYKVVSFNCFLEGNSLVTSGTKSMAEYFVTLFQTPSQCNDDFRTILTNASNDAIDDEEEGNFLVSTPKLPGPLKYQRIFCSLHKV